MCGKDFATIPTSTSGEPQRLADLADRRARTVRVDHRDAAGALVAVARQHHVVDVLATGRLHVDVDVRQLVAHRVQEALEREVVAERVDVGDPQQVAHERAGRRAPAGDVDPHRADVGHDVGDREEVRRVAHPPDHRELEVDPVTQALVLGEAAVVDAGPAPLGEDRVGAAPGRRREVREVDPLQAEVEPASVGDLEGRVAEVRPLGEQQPHRLGRLQPSLGVGVARRGWPRSGPARACTPGRRRGTRPQARGTGSGWSPRRGPRGARPVGASSGSPRGSRAPSDAPPRRRAGRGRTPRNGSRRLGGRVREAADGEAAHVRARAGEGDQPGRVRADLDRVDRRVAPLPSMCASVSSRQRLA